MTAHPPPFQRVLAMIAELPSGMLTDMIDFSIAALDARTGDCDFEPEEDFGPDDVGEPTVDGWSI